jgi:hypothetical protein
LPTTALSGKTDQRNFLSLMPILVIILFVIGVRVRVMVFNAAFNNISVISWQSVLLVEETRVPEENH